MAQTQPSRADAPRAEGARVLIVAARFYREIVDNLVEAAEQTLRAAGAQPEIIDVPGALEIPGAIAAAQTAGEHGRIPAFEGYVAIGCVIRGETIHFEVVSHESARGLMDLTIGRGLAVGNGVITVENQAQALARSGRGGANKGAEAAVAALTMIALKRGWAGAPR